MVTDNKRMKKYPDNILSGFFRISVGIPIAYRYIAAINLDSYHTDEQPSIIVIYALLRPLFSSLFSIPAISAPLNMFFLRSVSPHRAKMSDDLLEILMYLRCT
jgi:hypothetical protein